MRTTCIIAILLAVTFSSHGFIVNLKLEDGQLLRSGGRGHFRNGGDENTLRYTSHRLFHNGDEEVPPPESFDWRTKGVISPVKNQGEIGDVIAIVAEECVESFSAIKTGHLEALSTAEVQDCCVPGRLMPDNVFECIHKVGGLCSQATYPALAGHCRNNSCQPEVQIQGGKKVPQKQVEQMVMALLEIPLMILIDASKSSFEMYTGGVYSDPSCSPTQVDHALQLVGYGEEGGVEFWICKNSWGAAWGESGYIRIKKGVDMCGIESYASYPY